MPEIQMRVSAENILRFAAAGNLIFTRRGVRRRI